MPDSPHSASAPLRIAVCAGEASGDLLGAGLIAALRRRYPTAEFAGIGGEQMRAAGCDTWFDAHELAVMGLAEVLRHLPRLLRLRRAFRERLLDWQPQVYVGIDAPDFNLGVERWLKQRGFATVHYVSPSVWAWREKRAEKIGRSADRVLCLFPMEPPIYARHAVDARFVGHPLADDMPLQPDPPAARTALGLEQDRPLLALLPGSRVGEITRLGADFLGAAARVLAAEPTLQVVAPMASARARDAFMRVLAAHPDADALRPALRICDGGARTLMIASDVILLASGTATLEAMLAKQPMVVAYKVAPLTYTIVKGLGLLKVDTYSLPNVLAGERVVPEFMQHDCTPDNLANAVLQRLRDPSEFRRDVRPRFERLHEQLRRDASATAADAVAELLSERARDGAAPEAAR
ncbi:lipid-A-disaccharide synthase [Lysobacter psychrotolerans]|uniref:Lipid-A-disaccharide synthase n=2 Tax=Montanilutibacter psychrotolerans TaxID=1327343 RepID=A0A3M8SM67_9GAMM|nr:lipid-A-disaccharide synthase [Lysobacter psychrotolerans]RNF81745.1 lipid-A-disaccharide synthase [Lysobacter psychrotolerans]